MEIAATNIRQYRDIAQELIACNRGGMARAFFALQQKFAGDQPFLCSQKKLSFGPLQPPRRRFLIYKADFFREKARSTRPVLPVVNGA